MRIEDAFLDKNNAKKTFAIVDEYDCWDYCKLYEKTGLLCSVLRQQGIRRSDKVGVMCDNGASFFIAVMSTFAVGAVVVPIEPQFPANAVKEIIRQFDIKLICASGKSPEEKDDGEGGIVPGIPVLRENLGEWCNAGNGEDTGLGKEPYDEADPAVIFLTSGTSGRRKGVVLTHKALSANIAAILCYMNPSEEDVFFITKSMIHVSTLVGELLVALKAGCKVLAYNPRVSPIVQLRRICTCKPTIVFVNPTILKLLSEVKLLSADLSNVRLVYTSGAVIDRETITRAEHLFRPGRILNVYGLTEAGPRVSAQDYRDAVYKYGSVGKPLEGVQVVVSSDKGTGCKPGEAGNLYIRTPSLMLGYHNDMEATQEKIRDGWLDTGDVGYFDSEGYLYIVGRKDDMIIRNAYNIDPHRVEKVVGKLASVSECIVFGIDDIRNSKKIVCAIKKTNENLSLDMYEIIKHCLAYLAPYECPQEIIQWTAIPSTYNGKPSRKLAIEKYLKEKGLQAVPYTEKQNN